ncbi:mynd domain-containing protein [Colletotrichum sojae]|uniref:Mynd domain-containing protein n=1 Tax=Colletotrichum sojae TaxID=2175907 RepID=A0A8H6J6H8_9PEZI|nr:mynd domain-containing protein [Colletotrichum sojae]
MTDKSSPPSLPQRLEKHINTSTGYKSLSRWIYFHERPETDAEKAKSVSGGAPLLPKWWNEEKRKECEALGATDAKEWSSLARKVYEHLIDGRKIARIYVPSYDSNSDDDELFADWGFKEGFDPLDYKMDYAYTNGYGYGYESELECSLGDRYGYAGYEESKGEESLISTRMGAARNVSSH